MKWIAIKHGLWKYQLLEVFHFPKLRVHCEMNLACMYEVYSRIVTVSGVSNIFVPGGDAASMRCSTNLPVGLAPLPIFLNRQYFSTVLKCSSFRIVLRYGVMISNGSMLLDREFFKDTFYIKNRSV